jgi:hypothetical protein
VFNFPIFLDLPPPGFLAAEVRWLLAPDPYSPALSARKLRLCLSDRHCPFDIISPIKKPRNTGHPEINR